MISMLCSTVLLDTSLKPTSKRELLYNSLNRFLRDILKVGVILVDEKRELINHYLSAIDNWDRIEGFTEGSQYASDLRRLLILLDKRNRFVITSPSESLDLPCEVESCIQHLSIARKHNPDFIIVSQNCFACACENLSSSTESKILKINSFDQSTEFQSFSDGRGIRLTGWNQEDFERRILVPLFRHTENVFLYDKQLGKYFHRNPGYKTTINWLLDVYLKNNLLSPNSGVFEVHIENAKKPEEMKAFERELQSLCPGFRIVPDSHDKHDRFLETDQVEITIGQGFDLLSNSDDSYPRFIKDTYVGYSDGFVGPLP